MKVEAKHFRLGLFVLGAAVLAAAGTVLLGAGAFFRPKVYVETTVDESVIGLDPGSSVRYRGVLVGEVESIGFVNTFYGVEDNRVRIVIALFPGKVKAVTTGASEELIRKLMEQGLRIRLASQGLTGGLYLELDYLDAKEHPIAPIRWQSQYPYLASVKSTGLRLTDHVEKVLESLGKVPFQEIGDKLASALDGLDTMVKKLEPAVASVQGLATETSELVKEFRKELDGSLGKDLHAFLSDLRGLLEKEIAPALRSIRVSSEKLPGTIGRVDASLERVSSALRRTDRLLAGGEGSFDETMDNLRAVTQDLRDVSGTLKRYPASALFGDAPPRPEGKR